MADWDKDRPKANEQWNIGDQRIRNNFDFLQQALQVISTFAVDPNDPVTNMMSKVSMGPIANRPNTGLSEQTGAIYFDTDFLEVWYCLDGTTDLWANQRQFSDDLLMKGAVHAKSLATDQGASIIGAFSVGLTSTFTGIVTMLALLNANGGIAIPTAKQLTVPAENWLKEGTDTMRAHAHSARHSPGSTNGAWVTPNDFHLFSIQQVRHSTALLGGATIPNTAIASQTFGAAGAAKCSVTVNTAGRLTTSRGFLYGELWLAGTNVDVGFDMELYRATSAGLVGTVGTKIGGTIGLHSGYGPVGDTLNAFRYVTGLPANQNHEFALHAVSSNQTNFGQTTQLTYVDLGAES